MDIPARLVIRAFVICGLAASFTAACRPSRAKEPAGRMDAILAGLVSEGEPGAAVLVIRDGRVVYEGCRGVADLRTKRPIDGRTNFRLASVTKQFTAAAVMLLVRDGKLRYDDRLTDFFPDFPGYGRAITIRNLLHHTSGLADYEDLMAPVDPSLPVEQVQIKDAEVLELLKRQTAGKFPPGSRWAYSNSGYVVLGLVVAKISGLPFDDYLRERIFELLKMTDTVAFVRGKNEVPHRAFGHGKESGRWVETDQSPTSATLGDGGIYSSLTDMAKWDEALQRHTLLSESEMLPALTPLRVPAGPPTDPDGKAADYGFGWFLDPWKGHGRMWHSGETMGFRTAIQRFTGDGLSVIVLSNFSDLNAAPVALRAAEFYLEGR
jgi:CubicO group peptidase (beta-lactamase class C family)